MKFNNNIEILYVKYKKYMEFLIIKIKMYLCKNNLCVTVIPVYSRI